MVNKQVTACLSDKENQNIDDLVVLQNNRSNKSIESK